MVFSWIFLRFPAGRGRRPGRDRGGETARAAMNRARRSCGHPPQTLRWPVRRPLSLAFGARPARAAPVQSTRFGQMREHDARNMRANTGCGPQALRLPRQFRFGRECCAIRCPMVARWRRSARKCVAMAVQVHGSRACRARLRCCPIMPARSCLRDKRSARRYRAGRTGRVGAPRGRTRPAMLQTCRGGYSGPCAGRIRRSSPWKLRRQCCFLSLSSARPWAGVPSGNPALLGF